MNAAHWVQKHEKPYNTGPADTISLMVVMHAGNTLWQFHCDEHQ